MFDSSFKSMALAGLLLFNLGSASAFPRLVARAPPATGSNVCSVSNSTDPGSYCAFRGTVQKPATPLSTSQENSLANCRNGCLEARLCKSFSYDRNTKQCKQYGITVDRQKPNKRNGGPLAYWNRQCFTAVYYNNKAVGNPGFENGMLSPWTSRFIPEVPSSTVNVVSSGGDNSVHSVEIATTNTEDPPIEDNAYIDQSIFLCGGVPYTLTWSQYQIVGDTSTNDGTCQNSITLFLNSPGGASVYSQHFNLLDDGTENGAPAGQWAHFSTEYTAQQTGQYTIEFQINSNHPGCRTKVRIDNVQIQT